MRGNTRALRVGGTSAVFSRRNAQTFRGTVSSVRAERAKERQPLRVPVAKRRVLPEPTSPGAPPDEADASGNRRKLFGSLWKAPWASLPVKRPFHKAVSNALLGGAARPPREVLRRPPHELPGASASSARNPRRRRPRPGELPETSASSGSKCPLVSTGQLPCMTAREARPVMQRRASGQMRCERGNGGQPSTWRSAEPRKLGARL